MTRLEKTVVLTAGGGLLSLGAGALASWALAQLRPTSSPTLVVGVGAAAGILASAAMTYAMVR